MDEKKSDKEINRWRQNGPVILDISSLGPSRQGNVPAFSHLFALAGIPSHDSTQTAASPRSTLIGGLPNERDKFMHFAIKPVNM